MPSKATLEQVERLAAQLPPAERLKLVARICEELRCEIEQWPKLREERRRDGAAEVERGRYRRQMQEALRLAQKLDPVIEAGTLRPVDATTDLQDLREERVRQLASE